MNQYVKRPVVVEAEQWWPPSDPRHVPIEAVMKDAWGEESYSVRTIENSLVRVLPGAWIMTGVRGEKYPCDPEIFQDTYVTVEEFHRRHSSEANARDLEYEQDCLRTEATMPDFTNMDLLWRTLVFAQAVGKIVDFVKKAVFYKQDVKLEVFVEIAKEIQDALLALLEAARLGHKMAVDPEDLKVHHGIVGNFGEAGELAGAGVAFLRTGELPIPNIIEELGDQYWFNTPIIRRLGVTIQDIRRINTAKLRKRFPEKFELTKYEVRDLEGESQSMEVSRGLAT